MSIFKGITKRNFIKDYDEKDGLPFFLMEDFESLDCDEVTVKYSSLSLTF